jgi:hypothetical protein
MHRTLIELSTYFEPDPSAIFQRVLGAISALYGGTMAMINLVDRERVRFHAISEPHPTLMEIEFLPLSETY